MERELQTSFELFCQQAKEGNLIPVIEEVTADYETPLSVYEKIKKGYSFLFESAEMGAYSGRYSFIGSDPRLIFKSDGKKITVQEGERERSFITKEDPLKELEKIMARFKPTGVAKKLPFFGGAVGYLGYDAVQQFEPMVGSSPVDSLELPELCFMLCNEVLVFDHLHRVIYIVANVFLEDFPTLKKAYVSAGEKINRLLKQLEKPLLAKPLSVFKGSKEDVPLDFQSNTTQEEYESMVRKAKEYIHAGDIFQVVPSQRFETEYSGDPVQLYRALRQVNPSPYMFCFDFDGEFSLVGSSPEVHVRSIDGEIEIRPLAGTRPRGKTVEEDEALAEELLNDPKECAEHIMLVDLARNDVGRVSEYQSVLPTDLMIIERYSHVMHIVSNVVGKLRAGYSAYDIMRATFPAGTVSGSPKVRAMQIIYELEKNKRGTYAGAIGYFGFDGNLDSCIALRTCLLKGNKAYIQAGAGVVADSDPTSEYKETVNKAMAILRAVERAKFLSKENA